MEWGIKQQTNSDIYIELRIDQKKRRKEPKNHTYPWEMNTRTLVRVSHRYLVPLGDTRTLSSNGVLG